MIDGSRRDIPLFTNVWNEIDNCFIDNTNYHFSDRSS